jgi:hypothetical protein
VPPARSVPRLPPVDGDEPFTRLVDQRPVPVPPAVEGPRVRRREEWVELPEPYAGFRFRLHVNASTRTWMRVAQGGDDAEAALRSLVLEHNGWCDEDGVPYPPASEAAFWAEIPTELAALVLKASQVEMGKLGSSLGSSGLRSAAS